MDKIAIIGLGYVGLPLAVAFGAKRQVVGFDVNGKRICDLKRGEDFTCEVSVEELGTASQLSFTDSLDDIADCSIFIITVPTPVDNFKAPDLTSLIKASEDVGKILKCNDLVIYESTVYPGATEEVCVPVLEKFSSLAFNQDFYVGYSPERVNPGDKEHRLTSIKKVTSGSTPAIAQVVDSLYADIIAAGTHKASSIKVAEAAKVIENTQRDLNIALMNELAMIFSRLGIDTSEVLVAAGTKWNFLPFKPGLVGGHCIGVDPYYLTYKAQSVGYHPEIVLAGRRVNDRMGSYVASELVKAMIKSGHTIANSRVLVMGITFKENCPDLRNTRVIDVIRELQEFGCKVDVTDCWADDNEARDEYDISLTGNPELGAYDGVVLAVPHREYEGMDANELRAYLKGNGILYDLKGVLLLGEADLRL